MMEMNYRLPSPPSPTALLTFNMKKKNTYINFVGNLPLWLAEICVQKDFFLSLQIYHNILNNLKDISFFVKFDQYL